MSFYKSIYQNLCSVNRIIQEENMHKHHIIPKHMGGGDEKSNVVILTIREHIIAHFLLWKIHRNINDLRSMHMLGAKLTKHQRHLIGKWCVENKIGIHGASENQKKLWNENSVETRKRTGKRSQVEKFGLFGISEVEKKKARQKGITTQKNQYEETGKKNYYYYTTEEGRKERSRNGGKAHKGKFAMFHGKSPAAFKRISPKDVNKYLALGYKFGSNKKPNLGRKMENSHRRRAVTDGKNIFESIKAAGTSYGISPAAVIYRIKSTKNTNWNYVSDT